MENFPTFGEKKAGQVYVTRLGVYAVVEQDGKFCLVQAPNGAWFLPGGEIEAGENHERALKRELLEELGATAELGVFCGQADEYFYSSHRDTYYHNPAFIYETQTVNFAQAPLEDFNHIGWFAYDDALTALKRGSHRWGLEQAKKMPVAR